jgi:4'-phosphopantetheinyl transferase
VVSPVGDAVHLWRLRLAEDSERHWRGFLTNDERQRADRFCFAADRHRFTVTRAVLRTMLGHYLGAAPTSLCLEGNAFGKPLLAVAQNPDAISFNVTHSGDCALLAFGQGRQLGVDIEQTCGQRNIDDLAKSVFSPRQYVSWLDLPVVARWRAFFEAWTRCEAIAKALGGGLSVLPECRNMMAAGAPGWVVCDVAVGDEYAAAVAVQAWRVDLHLWDWHRDLVIGSRPA